MHRATLLATANVSYSILLR